MHFTENTDPATLTKYQLGAYRRWKKHQETPIHKLFWDSIEIGSPDECWPHKGTKKGAYGSFRIPGYRPKQFRAHRLAWIFTHGHIPDNLYVLHKCDNPPCCNPDHLFLGTHQDNMDDMLKKGRKFLSNGELCHTHKLTSQDVIEIRRRYDPSKTTYQMMATEFGVSEQTIREAVTGVNWKHIPKPERKLIYNRGQAHPRSHLTDDDVRSIRKLYAQGMTKAEIGRRFRISQPGVRKIVTRITWTHID